MKKALFAFMLLVLPGIALAAGGGIYPEYPYAWSEKIGWINFYTDGNVQVSDAGLTGSAWSQNLGWINLHPSSTTYVRNDGAGNLSGYAWGESIGFIDFAGVTIDADGFFHGYASSSISGRISFNCENSNSCAQGSFKVRTYWRKAVTAAPVAAAPSGGGGGGGSPVPPSMPAPPLPLPAPLFPTSTPPSAVPAAAIAPSISPTAANGMLAAPSRAAALPAKAQCPVFTKALKRGMSDVQVRLMQSFLMQYGYMATAVPTSYFGAKSEAAVKKFQAAHASEILAPWGESKPSGWWYITTRKVANQLVGCVVAGTLRISAGGKSAPIRSKPVASSPTLLTVASGNVLRYYDQNSGWYYVEYLPGKNGWIYGPYVTVLSRSGLEQ